MQRSTLSRFALSAGALSCLLGVSALVAPHVDALKYAKREHNILPDKSLPVWVPAKIETVPEEEFNIVGADVMDEMTLGWAKMMRKAYPRLSVTVEARASGSGGPGLTNGISHAAPVGRELLPAEENAFVANVRRQNIRHNSRRRLAECGLRLGVDVRRRVCGVASADVRWSFA